MYEHFFQFFGLRQNPFHVSPDPRFYFPTEAHEQAISEVMKGIETRRGLSVLTGEPGTGKTILLHRLLDWLGSRQQSTCYIFNSQLKPGELFELILQDFGVPCESREKRDMLVALNHWLLERRRMGDSPVLVVDEAQGISLRTLNRLNLLLNLEMDGTKLLQIVLAGQLDLESRLRRPELWQLQQRIIARTSLKPLSFTETTSYVRSRLENDGATETVFSDESIEAVHLCAHGIPRVVNLLCEHALIAAYTDKIKPVGVDTVNRVAREFDLSMDQRWKEQELRPARFTFAFPSPSDEEPKDDPGDSLGGARAEVAEVPEPNVVLTKWPIQPPLPIQPVPPCNISASAFEIREEPSTGVKSQPAASAVAKPVKLTSASKLSRREPKELPVNWSRPNFTQRCVSYWRAVRRSFLQDWHQFFAEPSRTAPHVRVQPRHDYSHSRGD